MDKGIVIFLEGEPRVITPLWRGRFWHVAILYNGKVYETLSNRQHRITKYENWPFRNDKKIAIETEIDPMKLEKEITSGTDCATYVARVLGIDNSSGDFKNPEIFPEDICNILKLLPTSRIINL